LQQRLDLAAQAAALELARRESQHTRRWRWLQGTELRVERERESGQPTLTGPGATLQLPVPNTGAGRVARAAALVEVRAAQLATAQLGAQNRIARDGALLAVAGRSFDVHARQLLAQNQRLLELAGEQQNFMLIGSFELLAARRRQIEGHDLWIDAIESWWHAFNDLSYESGTALPIPAAAGYVSAEDLP
jgi:cobalt-zinc-cadmium efflux system outer membrane protein